MPSPRGTGNQGRPTRGPRSRPERTDRQRSTSLPSPEAWAELDRVARAAARRSHALANDAPAAPGVASPSRGPRGAALLAGNGAVFPGTELGGEEGVALSAERLAIYAAHMAGETRFRHLVLRGGARGGQDAGPPTSATLQVLFELAPELVVHWGTKARPKGGQTVRELLPGAFGSGHLAPSTAKGKTAARTGATTRKTKAAAKAGALTKRKTKE